MNSFFKGLLGGIGAPRLSKEMGGGGDNMLLPLLGGLGMNMLQNKGTDPAQLMALHQAMLQKQRQGQQQVPGMQGMPGMAQTPPYVPQAAAPDLMGWNSQMPQLMNLGMMPRG